MDSYFARENVSYSPLEIKEMVESINENGFVEIKSFFKSEVIKDTSQYIHQSREELKADSFSLRGAAMEPCTFVELQQSAYLKSFLTDILQEAGVDINGNHLIHQVIRCTSGKQDANQYHFDAYNLTLLMPIITPDNDKLLCGDLIVFPNIRKFSRNLPKNMLLKLIFQNKFVRRMATQSWFKTLFKATTVKVKPGNAYLFYGFRSYHGNIGVDDSLIRATALFHYYDPFSNSKFIKSIEKNRLPPQSR